jgi:hypothetical protein
LVSIVFGACYRKLVFVFDLGIVEFADSTQDPTSAQPLTPFFRHATFGVLIRAPSARGRHRAGPKAAMTDEPSTKIP